MIDKYNKIAIRAAVEAGRDILKIYDSEDFDISLKGDASPLTKADIESNSRIMEYLKETPFPVISEENKQIEYDVRKQWEKCWIVDPLDGTKEFIKKNGEFTVNIALCSGGRPIFGVIYVPVSRELYFGDVVMGNAYKIELDENHNLVEDLSSEDFRIFPAQAEGGTIRVVGSRSHMNQETQDFINETKMNFDEVEIVSKGSSLKFCMVAEGIAHIYPRFAPTMEWDTAAGQAICMAAGLKVISKETDDELMYNKENLLNPYFIVQQ